MKKWGPIITPCNPFLIIAPTRELVQQIHQDIEILGSKTGLRSVTVYGGVGIQPQVQLLKSADIVVACPGRLLDHIRRRTVDLSQVEVLVLDEADQMFDMGFLPDVRRILSHLPQSDRQTFLFSATMPTQIRRLADNYDMPSTPEAYIHRIGRTGRAERSGEAFTLITDEDKQMVKAIHGAIGMPVEQRTLADFNYHAPEATVTNQRGRRSAQQLPGGRTGRKQNRRAVKGAFAWLSPQKARMAGGS